jgi:DNA polymerase III epsilon subunit-like protein
MVPVRALALQVSWGNQVTMAVQLVFLDLEASSLEAGGFPIEVGWACVRGESDEITTGAVLIRPAPDWTVWSEAAQRVHGISRQDLELRGRPLAEVADVLDAAFGSAVVLSDAPAWDSRWIDALYDALGRTRGWHIKHAIPLLRELAETPVDRHWLMQHLDDPRPHRAEADARLLAQAYVHLRRQRVLRTLRLLGEKSGPARDDA